MLQRIERKRRVSRRLVAATGVLAAIVAVALTLVPSAFNNNTPNGLYAYVVATTRGPLPACSAGQDCTASTVWYYIHVINLNPLEANAGGKSRQALANAFVVSSVDTITSIDGIQQPGTYTQLAPPGWTFRGGMGRWPSTVTCTGSPGAYTDPCNVVGNPAVIPGENTVVFYPGWAHAAGEPNGKYVFKYIIHGTLNGNPVDLTATSPPITMTG